MAERGRVGRGEMLLVFALAVAWALLVRPGPLSLPYFWDEGDVYAPGARWLAMHGFDATPGHFPDDWSRGHPPLLYLLVALAFRAFGTGPAVGHAVMVPFTALALAATYVLGAERGSRAVGIFAVALLGTTPLFMSMGAQVLPEMPLTALTVVALVLFSRGNVIGAAIVGIALVWIKETGVFTPLAICCAVSFDAWRTKRLRSALPHLASSLSPLIALAAFFVWQRATAGYFVFPHHVGLLTARPFVPLDLLTVFSSLFLWHGRWVATVAALASVCFLATQKKRVGVDPTILALLFLVLWNAVFFSKMFWLERYALPAHPGICVLVAALIFEAGSLGSRRWLAAAPIAIAAALGILSLHAPTDGAPEQTFGYADVVASHREAIARVEALGGDPLVVTTWPLTTELHEPWLGFAHRPTRAVHPDYLELHPSTRPDIALIDGGSSHRGELREMARRVGLSRSLTLSFPHTPSLEVWVRPGVGLGEDRD